jgi:hypothetical protein
MGILNSGTLKQWTDLSFLNIQSKNSQNPKACAMYGAQISISLCGTSNAYWTGYAFTDVACDRDDPDAEIANRGVVKEDPIVSSSNNPFDANKAILNPREYFLMALEFWITRVQGEHTYLVRKLERSVLEYVCYCLPD